MFRTGFRPDRLSAVRLSALGVAAVLVLGGCSGSGDDPGAEAAEGSISAAPSGRAGTGGDATESASASPTPMPTPPAAAYKAASAEGPAENVPLPVMPELAKQESKEGLREFARHWYALINYGFETGDPKPIEEISGPYCSVCKNFYTMLSSGFHGDDWMVGGQMTVLNTQSSYEITSHGQYQILVQVEQGSYEYRGLGGTLYGAHEGVGSSTVQMIEAKFGNGQWLAHNVVTIQ